MELSMDVSNLKAVVAEIKAKGVEIYLPPIEIDMGSGSKGMIAYIRDPDGTIIELVEVKTVAWVSLLKAYDRITG
jgi:predicted enzyme related to lactoylglutathione lyase